ncbi:MAG TPA: hypothetical protein P5228_12440 [Bacteroidales bacterium]|nr:hypothetical protein [Bacteroidales bacterium]HRZ49637.1 hypothetical protein [Bacteroidales bacterium]
MNKRIIAKVALFVFIMAALASCRAPRECWGVSSDADQPSAVQKEVPAN